MRAVDQNGAIAQELRRERGEASSSSTKGIGLLGESLNHAQAFT